MAQEKPRAHKQIKTKEPIKNKQMRLAVQRLNEIWAEGREPKLRDHQTSSAKTPEKPKP